MDLHRLVEQQFPQRLSGHADVTLVRAKFRNGRLVDASGSLVSGGGTIGSSLLHAAAGHLRLGLSGNPNDKDVAFNTIDLSFDVHSSVLRVRGHCAGPPGVVVSDALGRALLVETHESVPILSVVRMLVPNAELQAPLTRETSGILSVFPLPDSQ